MKLSSVLLVSSAAIVLLSCKHPEAPADPSSLRFDVDKITILLDDTLTAVAVRDSHDDRVSSTTVGYTSSNLNVVTVDQSGRIRGLALGTTTITARDGELSATLEVTVAPHFIEIATGATHTCGITGTSQLYCWGWDDSGQLGVGTSSGDCMQQTGAPCSLVPIPVAGGDRFVAVTLGVVHTCALTASGVAYCWGGNYDGAVGIGTSEEQITTPTPVVGGHTFVSLGAGYLHTCGITTQGDTYCWGLDNTGQLGAGTAATDRCQFGYPDSPCSRVPIKVVGGQTFVQVTGSTLKSCGRTAANTIYCWGLEVGAPPSTECEPERVTACTRTPFLQVSGLAFPIFGMGEIRRCGQKVDGTIQCWGADFSHFGNGSEFPTSSNTPVNAAGGKAYEHGSVLSGHSHVCAISSGAVECWGDNTSGEAGGTIGVTRNVPGPVNAEGITFSKIFSGPVSATSCGIATTGRAYCWGLGSLGQLGNNAIGSSAVPVMVKLVR